MAANPEKGSATVLSRKGESGIFEEVIGEDDEPSHEHGEGDFLGLAGSDEAEVKRFQDGVMPGSDERGQIEDGAHLRAAAGDVALAAELATVVIERSDAGQSGRVGFGEGAQREHQGDQRRGGERAEALDLLEAIDPRKQLGGLRDLRGHQRLEWTDAAHLRHCTYVGMREDKKARQVVRET